MTRGKTHTDELATRLVDAAGELLSDEGASALTVRRLASLTGTSTMAIYTLFGDKQGLLSAMYREGFDRLRSAVEVASRASEDQLEALSAIAAAYRRVALANPHLYQLMFGQPIVGFVPDTQATATAHASYSPLVEGVQRCLDTGTLVGPDAEAIAEYFWAVCHGMVSLELAGHLTGSEQQLADRYADAVAYSAVAFLPSS
jgi:AcrR family transcriptional regulator